MNALQAFRAEFPVSRTHVFLNHAGVSPTSTRVVKAVHAFMDSTARMGRPSFDVWEALATGCRERFARLIGCAPDEVAFVRNTSHGLSLLAAGLDWRPGDRVAAAASVEYPSNVYPWMDLERRGVAALDLIPADDAGTVTVEAAARVLRPGTRVLAVSSAQYATGAVTNLDGLGRLCRERGVLLCRFEEGSLAYQLIAGFSAALDLLEEAGVERIAAHVCGLVSDLAARLERLGGEISPGAEHRRHILAFSHPDVAGEALEEGLAAAGVVVSLRRGRVRVSPHLYNTFAEMERVADAVRALLRPRRPASPPAVNPGGTP